MRINISNERSFVLECVCREKLVVSGREEEWRSRNPVFRCECGESLTLADKEVGEEEFLDVGYLRYIGMGIACRSFPKVRGERVTPVR